MGLNNVYVMNTYFFTMMEDMNRRNDYNYKKLEKFITRKGVNIKNYIMLVVPINIKNSHWFMMAVDLVNEVFYILDSMKSNIDSALSYISLFKRFF